MRQKPLTDQRGHLPIVPLILALLVAGCARTPPVAYYQLSADLSGRTLLDATPIEGKVIGIGPIRLRERLDRQQIIIRRDAHRLQLSASHLWIEPPAENISQVVRENLSTMLKTESFRDYPWSRSARVDYQLIIDVVRFDGDGFETATLETVWSIEDGEGKTLLPRRRSVHQAGTPAQDYEGVAIALSETLNLFCREIARELLLIASEAPPSKS
ncbi:MAG: PqiC family protein [Desulfurivibrionaceae bacterium]